MLKRILASRWVYALPLLACLLVMLPRLLSPQFGLMDDGRSLITAQKLSDGVWDMRVDVQEGRSRPLYWLYFSLFYALFGKQPFWFFLGNTLVLLVATLALMSLVRGLGCSRLHAWLAGLLFALAGPVIENFYTLTKGETPQVAWLVLSLLAMFAFEKAAVRAYRLFWLLLAALLLWSAHASKETSLVVLPISLVWWGAAWLGSRRRAWRAAWRLPTLGAYVLANGLAAAAFLALRAATVGMSLTGGSYTGRYAFDPAQISASLIRWAGWLARDFAYAVPLAILALAAFFVLRDRARLPVQLAALLWMAAWIVVFMPWGLMAEYYMLPFALGLAVAAGGWIEEGIFLWRAGAWARRGAAVAFALAALLFVAGLFNNLTTARVQLAVDAANAQALRHLAEIAPQGSAVLVNIQVPNEYFFASEDHLWYIWERPDLNLRPVAGDTMPALGEVGHYYLLVPQVENQPLQTVRMGVVEETQQIWNSVLEGYMAGQGWQPVTTVQRNVRLSVVDFARLFCPFIPTRAFCAVDAPLVDTRLFAYGWQIYSLEISK
ncbi:MAG: hypothetical protein ACOYYS_02000 [Chloroflexota bacterium]